MEVFNPYDYAKPVHDPHLFAGRSKLLKDIEYSLGLATSKPPTYKNFAITGPRGIGKTSMLNRVAQMAERRHRLLVSRLDLNNELASNQAALFHQLLDGIVTRLRERQLLGKTRHWTRWFFGRTSVELELSFVIGTLKAAQRDATVQVPQESLRKSLAKLWKQAHAAGIPAIVICIDEADLLAKDETTLQVIRNTFQHQEGYLLALCGTEDLLEKLDTVFGGIARVFDKLALGPLDGPDEVLECLQAPLPAREREMVTDSFARAVYEATGGAPYFVKLAAYHAYRACKEDGETALQFTPSVERAVLKGIQKTVPDEPGGQTATDAHDELMQDASPEEPAGETTDDPRERALELNPTESEGNDSDEYSSIARLINSILVDAVNRRATDVHVVPRPDGVVFRARVDGRLQTLATAPANQLAGISARLKILSNLDIAERRLPQDSRFKIRLGERNFVCRIVTAASIYGESVSLKITDPDRENRDVATLGLDEADKLHLSSALDRSSGLTLFTGPAHSGRTTTLYAAMTHLAARDLNVLSAEDRIKSPVRAASQFEVREMLGLSTYSLTRALFHHDPDVLAVRPLVDAETTRYLTKVAAGGQRVLATFAADDAPTALVRLLELVDDSLTVANALTLVIAQRLLRKVCEECRGESRKATTRMHCMACRNSGYQGQVGIFQMLPISEEIRSAIILRQPLAAMRETALHAGMRDLRDLAMDKVRERLTTHEEVERALRDAAAPEAPR